jgi:hypothetical protein
MQEKKRTLKQNRALWLYYTHLAETLNEAGLDQRKTLKPEIDIPWTSQAVHDMIWIPVQKAYLGIDSTTQLKTTDIDKVLNVITRHLADNLKIEVEFPSFLNFYEDAKRRKLLKE